MLGRSDPHSNSDTDAWRNSDTNSNRDPHPHTAAKRELSNVEPATRIDIHFLQRDFYLECRKCER
jgi:hypothetical protein